MTNNLWLLISLTVKPWVKTSLAPGSRVVTDYLKESGLFDCLEAMKFNVVGYGRTSCIGNSGPLPDAISQAVADNDLIVSAALSGNRNFEARIHPQVLMNFLMSPLLVIAYAIAGRMDIDLIRNLWVLTKMESRSLWLIYGQVSKIHEVVNREVKKEFYRKNCGTIYEGDIQWKNLEVPLDQAYHWDPASTYVKEAPFFANQPEVPKPIEPIISARILLKLGDSITTDHISPAGSFNSYSPAGKYLQERGIPSDEFNSYGSRRGNDEVMVRGTFANVRIQNELASKEVGFTRYLPSNEEMTVYEASLRYKNDQTPLLVLAESYERIHRSNLVGMGVIPLHFFEGENSESIGLSGSEEFTIRGLNDSIKPNQHLVVSALCADKTFKTFSVKIRLDSKIEIDYYRNGGILQYMLRQFIAGEGNAG